jgi:antirestriction protein ArdC
VDNDKRTELLRTLAEQVETLRTSEGWQHWLNVAAKFRTYSLNNQLLIAAQRPDATRVAGFRTWQQLGRQVRKGERGIRIVAPLIRRVTNDDRVHDSELRAVITGFKVVSVFDIAQTDGEGLPDLTMPSVTVADDSLLDRLMTTARAAGIAVDTVETAEDGTHGWYERERHAITLVASYPRAEQTRTMLHELAHAHDTTQGDDTRPVRELVAESAAYLVGVGHFGIAMHEASTVYVTSWGADTRTLEHLANRVRHVAGAVEELVRTNADVTA